MNYENEEWRAIPGYEGLYEASDIGRVRSLKYGKIRYVVISYDHNGYKRCTLIKQDGSVKMFKINRLVYMTFKGNIEDGMQIDHINSIRDDNRISNLRPFSARDNTIASYDRRRNEGTISSKYRGVTYDRRSKKWMVQLLVDGINRHIGSFECEQVARCVAELASEGVFPPKMQTKINTRKIEIAEKNIVVVSRKKKKKI